MGLPDDGIIRSVDREAVIRMYRRERLYRNHLDTPIVFITLTLVKRAQNKKITEINRNIYILQMLSMQRR